LVEMKASIGMLGGCKHVFCYDCIKKWSETKRTCPLDRLPFDSIKILHEIDGAVVEEEKLELRRLNQGNGFYRGDVDSDVDSDHDVDDNGDIDDDDDHNITSGLAVRDPFRIHRHVIMEADQRSRFLFIYLDTICDCYEDECFVTQLEVHICCAKEETLVVPLFFLMSAKFYDYFLDESLELAFFRSPPSTC
uniref:RING-type domain-containing protein n=1 Tax=Rodentolepis nana TaxID=102285 RepID=A0A0R3TEL9_RODNA